MLDTPNPASISDLPVQLASFAASEAQARGRFFNTGNAFNVKLPDVPNHIFMTEPSRALGADTPTGLIACDLSAELQFPFPATAPLVLARYARIRDGESLQTAFVASGVICYVIQGSGTTARDGESIAWSAGDIFILPGDTGFVHSATSDAVLWIVTNEPQLAFEGARPQAGLGGFDEVVHFTGEEIERQIQLIRQIGRNEATAGSALIFSSERHEASRNIMPSLSLAMNTLLPGTFQRAHRHNAAAIMLIIRGKGCYSLMDGKRKEWAPWATTVTPPGSVHSHYNGGDERAMFLVVQDGGLFVHARAMGFAFAEQPK